jgi:HK97 family phage major capsid protein
MQKKVYEVKDGDSAAMPTQTHEPDVNAAVLAEIKRFGDNTKAISDKLNQDLATLRREVESHKDGMDGLVQSKIDKLGEAILTRQEQLEKVTTKRVDDLEILSKKLLLPGAPMGPDVQKIFEAARAMKTITLSKQNKLSPEGIQEGEVNVDEFKAYCAAFHKSLRVSDKAITPEEYKLLAVNSDPDGGILVPPTMSARIIEKVYESDPIRQLAAIEQIGSDFLEIPEDLDEATDGWEGELVANGETGTPRMNMKRIAVHMQAARPRVTQKFLEDGVINVENWLANKVAARFARTEGAAFVTGNGINKPRGFMTYSDGSTFGYIEQVTSGDATAVTADGLMKLYYTLLEDYQSRAVWLMHRLTVLKVMLLKESTTNAYIWRPGLQQGQPSLLLGLPLKMSTTMPQVAANSLSIALADWQAAYTIVDRLGISVQRDPYTIKPLVEFYTRRRVGGDVVNFQAIKIQKIAA